MTKNKHDTDELHGQKTGPKLNKLRAAVLGANDGIVSISGLVVGVAGAQASNSTIFTAGMAGVIAGAISMAAGEYVSVSSQRDTERALLATEKYELKNFPKYELAELADVYKAKGLSHATAAKVAEELTEHDEFAAHAEAELRIDPNELASPWAAAFASAASFLLGSVIPMLAIVLPPKNVRIPATFVSVIVALFITGAISAKIGKAPARPAIVRVVLGGAAAMIVTYGIGYLFHVSGI